MTMGPGDEIEWLDDEYCDPPVWRPGQIIAVRYHVSTRKPDGWLELTPEQVRSAPRLPL